ncbi:alpha-mannosidase [Quercus suber]|uniref:Alpha-mannosidase n=1 Tax=Quercus suber TaxID=58331 RepID=A0AAW0KXI0_QUESU
MHDDAATHYIDMIDQTTLGHRFIKEEFGVVPRIGRQIVPFGHSAGQAFLLGAENGRVDALYSTPSIYTDAKYATDDSWTTKNDDFFFMNHASYADRANAYWTNGRVDALYSTPSINTVAKYATDGSWTTKNDDLFFMNHASYADRANAYWTISNQLLALFPDSSLSTSSSLDLKPASYSVSRFFLLMMCF